MDDHKTKAKTLLTIAGVLIIIGVLAVFLNNLNSKSSNTVYSTTNTLDNPSGRELTSTPTMETLASVTLPNDNPNVDALIVKKPVIPAIPPQQKVPESENSTIPTSPPHESTPTPTTQADVYTTTPTLTTQPTETQAASQITSTPIASCNQASQPEDITIPADTEVFAGQKFTKTWRIENTGSCTWGPSYSFSFFSGSLSYSFTTVQLDENVSPGSTWQVSVEVTAPEYLGAYYESWRLFDSNGQPMLDENGEEIDFSIIINVIAATPTPLPPASIEGRIIIDGNPSSSGISLTLENYYNEVIDITTTLDDGSFRWEQVPAYDLGYYVVFSQEANSQYSIDQVLSWVWVGPMSIQDGEVIQLPDIDISHLGFSQDSPIPGAEYSAAAITNDNPIVFQWTSYPNASDYWVDLISVEDVPIWQSPLVTVRSTAFNGTLSDGTRIQPGEYWWAVGARSWLGSYSQNVYTYLTSISLEE